MKRVALALVLLAPAAAWSQPRGIYLRSCDSKEEKLLEAFDEAQDAARAAELADRLLTLASQRQQGDRLVEVGAFQHRALRAEVLRRIEARPPVAAALRELQSTLAEGAELDPEVLLRRFPLADAAADAALALWSRASERADHATCFALLDGLRRWHPARLTDDAARARLARLEAAPAPAAAPGAPGRRLREVSNKGVFASGEEGKRPHSPAHAAVSGDRVVVSNGAQVCVFSMDGQLLGTIPAAASGTTDVPPASSGFVSRPAARPGVAYSPLIMERWLAPGRAGQSAGDPAIAGRFYALLALDAARARVLWWDGDASARGLPPGWGDAEPRVRDVLSRGHTVAVACDAGRVYVALTLKGEEPELWIYAYEAFGQASAGLKPAWPTATYLLSSERSRGSADEEPIAAEVVAALSLDGRGRLLCTTNLGLTACLSARDGELLWAREPHPDPRRRSGFRLRGGEGKPEPPPEPARFLRTKGEDRALFFSGSKLLCARLSDGETAWDRPRGTTTRTLVLPRLVAAYGGTETMVCAPDGTLLQQVRGLLRFPAVGQAALSEGSLFFPTLKAGTRPILYLERCEVRGRGLVRAQTRATQALSSVTEPVNLTATPGGVVAASRSRVVFLRWE